ncbi:hypothetical protein KKA03_03010 [archaeon]|nr:hypothetical protein [archaeon]
MDREEALKLELSELRTIIGRYDNFTFIIKGWCFTFYVGVMIIIYTKGSNLFFSWYVVSMLFFIILAFYSLEVHYRIVHGNCIERSHIIQEALMNNTNSEEPKTIRATIREEGKHGTWVFFIKFFKSLVNARVFNIYYILMVPTLLLTLVILLCKYQLSSVCSS